MGVLGGAVDENRGPQLTSARLIPPSERLQCTDSDPRRPPCRHRIERGTMYLSRLACHAVASLPQGSVAFTPYTVEAIECTTLRDTA